MSEGADAPAGIPPGWSANQEMSAKLLVGAVRDYAIFMLDVNGHVQSWNAGAERIKGYAAHEIIGRHFSTFYPPSEIATGKCEMELREASINGRFEDEGWRIRKDGTRFWANVVITAVRDDKGVLLGFGKVTRDLTERRNAEESLRISEERLRMLISSVKDYAIFTLDPEGRVTTWNLGAQHIIGYENHQILGRHFSCFYAAEDLKAGRPERELKLAAQDGRYEEENWRIRVDGSKFWANVVMSAMRDDSGQLIGFAKIMRDLTERREAELERARLAHAQETIRLRDEFLSIASHELRTPLTSIRLELAGLTKRLGDADPRTTAKLTRLNRGSARMGELVEALLDVSRISTGQLSLRAESVDLKKSVGDVADQLRPAAERANCPINVVDQAVDTPLVGMWDRLRLEQVFTNIISNAIRYAGDAPITVTLRREGDTAIVVVDDGGHGIAAADLQRIFGRFERATSPAHFGGLGLGLYVAREIVTGHGGQIFASNRATGGASFTVRLPLRKT